MANQVSGFCIPQTSCMQLHKITFSGIWDMYDWFSHIYSHTYLISPNHPQWPLEAGSEIQSRLHWTGGHEWTSWNSRLQRFLRNISCKLLTNFIGIDFACIVPACLRVSSMMLIMIPIILIVMYSTGEWPWLTIMVVQRRASLKSSSLESVSKFSRSCSVALVPEMFIVIFFFRKWRSWLVWKTKSSAVSQRLCTEGKWMTAWMAMTSLFDLYLILE